MDDERLGRYLDYAQLKREFYAENANHRYSVGSPFVDDRIDRAHPLDRVLFNGRWFMSGKRLLS
jgi:hypothetical protein